VDNQQAAAGSRRDGLFIFVSVVLIGTLAWRAFMPAHEYPMRTAQVMTMVFDAGMIVGIIGMRPRSGALQVLFWVALVAGLSLFAIRFTSDASWWTGHLIYSLPPR
jgi:hypothetical protein